MYVKKKKGFSTNQSHIIHSLIHLDAQSLPGLKGTHYITLWQRLVAQHCV